MPDVWRSFHPALKRLLLSDVIICMCEGMAGVFFVLYATNVVGISIAEYGVLVAVQVTNSILVYLPAALLVDLAAAHAAAELSGDTTSFAA